MINYERNSRLVLLKRSYPKICDHGVSIRAMVWVGAASQCSQLVAKTWRSGCLTGSGQNSPGQCFFNKTVMMPFGRRASFGIFELLQKIERMKMRTIKRMNILACVTTKKMKILA